MAKSTKEETSSVISVEMYDLSSRQVSFSMSYSTAAVLSFMSTRSPLIT